MTRALRAREALRGQTTKTDGSVPRLLSLIVVVEAGYHQRRTLGDDDAGNPPAVTIADIGDRSPAMSAATTA